MKVGKTDAFERKYLQKFKEIASEYGEFVNYERDRCARDIGIHFVKQLKNGEERVTTSLVWFQLKGLMKDTFSKNDFKEKDVKINIEVKHLKFWYLQPTITYLVVYIESKDLFLILNIQKYIDNVFGKAILHDKRNTRIIKLDKDSILDEQAFKLIIKKGDISEWQKAIQEKPEVVKICIKDYNLIWHLKRSIDEKSIFKVEFLDWQSKTRSEMYIKEQINNEWCAIRAELKYMSALKDLENTYPYLEFISNIDEDYLEWDDNEDTVKYKFESGVEIEGINASDEYHHFEFEIRLNDFGKQLLETIKELKEIGLLEINENIETEIISIAPWHARDV